MYHALKLKYLDEAIPSERTVYRIMEEIGLSHRPNRKTNGITKVGRNARKSEDLLKRDSLDSSYFYSAGNTSRRAVI